MFWSPLRHADDQGLLYLCVEEYLKSKEMLKISILNSPATALPTIQNEAYSGISHPALCNAMNEISDSIVTRSNLALLDVL